MNKLKWLVIVVVSILTAVSIVITVNNINSVNFDIPTKDIEQAESESTEETEEVEQTEMPVVNDVESGYIDNSMWENTETEILEDSSTNRYSAHSISDLPDYVLENDSFQSVLNSEYYSDDFEFIYVDDDGEMCNIVIYYDTTEIGITCRTDGYLFAVYADRYTEQTLHYIYPEE